MKLRRAFDRAQAAAVIDDRTRGSERRCPIMASSSNDVFAVAGEKNAQNTTAGGLVLNLVMALHDELDMIWIIVETEGVPAEARSVGAGRERARTTTGRSWRQAEHSDVLAMRLGASCRTNPGRRDGGTVATVRCSTASVRTHRLSPGISMVS